VLLKLFSTISEIDTGTDITKLLHRSWNYVRY